LNKERNFDDALEISNKAIYYYRKAIELNLQDDRLIHKYVMAIYMKYALIIPENERAEEKKKVYSDALALLRQLYPEMKNSIYINYDMSLLLIHNIDYYNAFESISAANEIKKYCEKIYNENPSFEDYDAGAILGRIHYLAPNIIFLLPWPDKALSKKYLEEALANNPESCL